MIVSFKGAKFSHFLFYPRPFLKSLIGSPAKAVLRVSDSMIAMALKAAPDHCNLKIQGNGKELSKIKVGFFTNDAVQ